MTIEPLTYQKVTAFKERMQLFDKVNELVDVINRGLFVFERLETSLSLDDTVIHIPETNGLITGYVGVQFGSITRVMNVTIPASLPVTSTFTCSAWKNNQSHALQIVRGTVGGTNDDKTLFFTMITDDNGTVSEECMTITVVNLSALKTL